MLSLPIREVLEPRRLVTAPPGMTVAEAARRMKEGKVGAMLVVENDCLVGIFTERDALFRVIAPGRDPSVVTLREVMTREPTTVGLDDPASLAGRLSGCGFSGECRPGPCRVPLRSPRQSWRTGR